MRIKFLQPMYLRFRNVHGSFDAGQTVDLPEREANRLLFVAGHRVKADEGEFKILETVWARKVSPAAFKGPQYQEPKWVRAVIIKIEELYGRALVVSDGEKFWAALGQLQKI